MKTVIMALVLSLGLVTSSAASPVDSRVALTSISSICNSHHY